HQPHTLSYKKLPNAERLGNSLKTVKVLTNTRCEATCSAIPNICDSYNLRRVNDDTFKYSCELFGPCVAQRPTNSTSLVVDHYIREGCPLQNALLPTVPDSAFSASSVWRADHTPARSRLKTISFPGAWAAGPLNRHQWLQVDFGSTHRVTGVATKGRYDNNQWTTLYDISYSSDGKHFECFNRFDGNKDRDTLLRHDFHCPIYARKVRILPQAWDGWISLRWELYGCSL
ncbi:unnamed protein product, partial [Owenia fusiformis]